MTYRLGWTNKSLIEVWNGEVFDNLKMSLFHELRESPGPSFPKLILVISLSLEILPHQGFGKNIKTMWSSSHDKAHIMMWWDPKHLHIWKQMISILTTKDIADWGWQKYCAWNTFRRKGILTNWGLRKFFKSFWKGLAINLYYLIQWYY